MQYLFNQFSKMALFNKEMDLCLLYNYFISQLKNENEIEFVSDHFMLFLKVAESSRAATEEIQTLIARS